MICITVNAEKMQNWQIVILSMLISFSREFSKMTSLYTKLFLAMRMQVLYYLMLQLSNQKYAKTKISEKKNRFLSQNFNLRASQTENLLCLYLSGLIFRFCGQPFNYLNNLVDFILICRSDFGNNEIRYD